MSDTPRSATPAVLIPFAIVTLIWGSTWIVIRDQLGVVPASWSVTYRFVIAGVTMLAWGWWRGDRVRLDRRGWLFAAGLGLAQFCLNFNFVYRSEQYVTSGLVALMYALLVVPNSILARIFLGQRMGRQLLVGSAIALAGVALLFLHEAREHPENGPAVVLGLGIALAGVFAASVANVMQATPTARAYPMVPLLGVAMLIGAAIDAAYASLTVGPPVFDWRWSYVGGLLYLGIIASAVAFTLYYGLIRTIGPAKAAYNGVVVPVIAMLLSTLFEDYRWSPLAGAGAALALAGLVVALKARRPNR
ncbi:MULTISPECIES: DMT family transporter [Sphingomonas]|jgi:drug/metabolite transporter (DMT)-like permease|uniref:Multidrug transporter n=1 Tax=Sphingomonas hankookensis TaxID=563996 RepID=A0ABR5YFK4_9SPHN|nr:MULTISPECIES: EamA family transporter [Sphingomonas]KZE17799.1 multidrug transporter [Sphingomonas hankookensis]PZT95930.1 MAG: EamA family transporter [Sphingomonas sp.]RSV22572.1 EamA family transporter [Sphingomonas sp. ABOLH]WCP72771.1 EamA family transporter [Sphingomonas hankookensis]